MPEFEIVWCGSMKTCLLPDRAERADDRFDAMPVPASAYDERRWRKRLDRRTGRQTRHRLMQGCLADRLRRRRAEGRG